AFFFTCFTHPYLYILINFIILTIVASSKLHNHHHHHSRLEDTVLLPSYPGIYDRPPVVVQIHVPDTVNITASMQTDYDVGVVASDKYLNETKLTPNYDTVTEGNSSIGFVYNENTLVEATINDYDFVGVRKDSSEFAFADENEKLSVSARFNHWKAVRASPEGIVIHNHIIYLFVYFWNLKLKINKKKKKRSEIGLRNVEQSISSGEGGGVGSGEGEEAGDAGEHVEDDNGGASYAVNSAFEEGRDVGDAGDAVEGFERRGGDEEVKDVRWEGEERVYEAEEAIAESRRVEPASGSLHQQCGAGLADAICPN
ncbi:hypothetical protein CR513_05467, partial [Mucuna pruriens]